MLLPKFRHDRIGVDQLDLSSGLPGLQAIPDLVILVVPHMAHRRFLGPLQFFSESIAEPVLDFDVLDTIQHLLREGGPEASVPP